MPIDCCVAPLAGWGAIAKSAQGCERQKRRDALSYSSPHAGHGAAAADTLFRPTLFRCALNLDFITFISIAIEAGEAKIVFLGTPAF